MVVVVELLELPSVAEASRKLKILLHQLPDGITGVYTMAGLLQAFSDKKLIPFPWRVYCSCWLADTVS